jgi:hypothetical protein
MIGQAKLVSGSPDGLTLIAAFHVYTDVVRPLAAKARKQGRYASGKMALCPCRSRCRPGMVISMARKLVIEVPDGSWQLLEQVPAEQELMLQEQLKMHPELLPLDELGLVVRPL